MFTVLLIAYNIAGCCVAATAQQKRGKQISIIIFKGGGIFFVTFSLASKLSWRQVALLDGLRHGFSGGREGDQVGDQVGDH